MSSKAGETAATFYVATDGDDGWSGKLPEAEAGRADGPFATIARARDAVRALIAGAESSGPVTVMVRGGTYFLDETIVLGPEDGGTEDGPVTYAAYPGETPVISGGRKIEADWQPHDGEVVVCVIPEVAAGEWYFRQLFANGERQTRASLPQEGHYFAAEPVDETAFKYAPGHFRQFHNLADVETVVFHSWNEARLLISELDEEERIVRFRDTHAAHPLGWGGGQGPNRYIIENVLEGLQQPGDWYLDRHSGELYYWPDGDVGKMEFIAPVLNQLIRVEGGLKERHAQHLVIRGFTFCHTDWPLPEQGYPDCVDVGDIVDPSAITFENVRHCAFEENCVKSVGTYALELTGDGNRIVGNEIFDIGGGGVICRSYGAERNTISYNHIHHCGVVYPSTVGINIDDGGGEIRHNLIHDIAHSGIYTRHWATDHQAEQRENQEQGLIIEYNEIFDVMQRINDGGGLFVRDSNMIIRNNLIHDVFSFSDRCPGWGIYLGCETRDTVVENNIVYRAREAVHVWFYDRHVRIENNMFMDGEISQINYNNTTELRHDNITTRRNIFCYSGDDSVLFKVDRDRSLPRKSDYNLFYRTDGGEVGNDGFPGCESMAEWRAHGFDTHSIVADPLFVDPAKDDYRLKPESPAFALGFKEIDMSTVGLR